MIRTYDYARSGDDIRIGVSGYSRGREAVARLEAELRAIGLAVNDAKTHLPRRKTYEDQLRDVEAARGELGARLHAARVRALKEQLDYAESLEELEGIVTDELIWGLYAGTHTIEDVVGEMTPLLKPDITDVVEELFRETIEQAPGNPSPLTREQFHGRLVRSLRMMSAGRSTAGIADSRMLLFRFPDETNEVASYLKAAATEDPDQVRNVISGFLLKGVFRHDWQEAWVYEPLTRCFPLAEDLIRYLNNVIANEDRSWFLRCRGALLLAQAGIGDQETCERMWRLAPAVVRPEIIAAATWLETEFNWAERFLMGCRGDPVHEVVVTHVRDVRPG